MNRAEQINYPAPKRRARFSLSVVFRLTKFKTISTRFDGFQGGLSQAFALFSKTSIGFLAPH